MKGLSVGFILLENFTLLAFSSFIEVIRIAADKKDLSKQINCEWTIMSASAGLVSSSCNVQMKTSKLDPSKEFDYLIIVGGLMQDGKKMLSENTKKYIQLMHAKNTVIIGLCTGVFALIEAGIISNGAVCVNSFHEDDLHRRYPQVQANTTCRYLDNGSIISSKGGAASSDVALLIIERFLGAKWAIKANSILSLERIDNCIKKNQFYIEPIQTSNKIIRKILSLMEKNLNQGLSNHEISSKVHLSKRQIERIFRKETGTSIQKYFKKVKLQYGHWLLNNTSHSILKVAIKTGYMDQSHFAKDFKTLFSKSPKEVREQNLKGCSLKKSTTFCY